jgi:hypothetical protein
MTFRFVFFLWVNPNPGYGVYSSEFNIHKVYCSDLQNCPVSFKRRFEVDLFCVVLCEDANVSEVRSVCIFRVIQ